MDSAWTIVAAVTTGFMAVVGALIVINLKSIKSCLATMSKRMDRHDDRLEKLESVKIACKDEFVNIGQFLREAGYNRQSIEALTKTVRSVEAKIDNLNQMPQIAGQIASQTVKEMLEWQEQNVKQS